MRRRASRVWIGLVLVGAAAGAGVLLHGRSDRPRASRFETAKVDRGRIVSRVTATGILSALVTVQVGSQVSGRIQRILVDFNTPVKKGEMIATIDPQLFEAALEQARANELAAHGSLQKAKVQAADAARQLERARTLAARQYIPQADLDTAQANAGAARAQVDVASGSLAQEQAALHQAEVNLGYTKILSPTDGIVISRNVDVGQTVAASLQAPTLFVIAEDLRKMQVDTSVAEADVGKLWPGMEATFRVDAYPSKRFAGTVRQIRNAPQTVQNVVTYDAVIDVENPDLELKPGMTANVTFSTAEKEGILRIPNAALRFRPTPDLLARAGAGAAGAPERGAVAEASTSPGAGSPGGEPRPGSPPSRDGASTTESRQVWKIEEGEPRPVTIRTGLSDGTLTEVVEGDLAPGDELVTDVVEGAEEVGRAPARGAPNPLRRIF